MTFEYAKRLIGNEMKSAGYALHEIKKIFTAKDMYDWMNFTDFCLYGDPEVSLISTVTTDNPPVISDISEQITQRDIAITVPFTISDDRTPAESLILSVTSSNTALVPNANLVFGGAGAGRNLTITPAKNITGSATITITAYDGKNKFSETFSVVGLFILIMSNYNDQ